MSLKQSSFRNCYLSVGLITGAGMHPRRVARWFIFKPKIPIWVNFGGSLRLENVDIFYGHLEYFKNKWDIV
jgi:hypothetical protein